MSQKTLTLTVRGDTVFEANETFFVRLSGDGGGTIASGKGTIKNDDPLPG